MKKRSKEDKSQSNSPAKTRRTRGKGRDNRKEALLEAAAYLFAKKGYAATSIRDIATEVGILSGSIYYHFESKEQVLIEVHSKGVSQVLSAVKAAIEKAGDDPWDRLTEASAAHLEVLLGPSPFSLVVTPQFTQGFPEPLRSTLISQRDEYEKIIAGLVRDLALPKGVNRRYFRLALLGSLNWTSTWYHPGGSSPSAIARHMIKIYRTSLDSGAT